MGYLFPQNSLKERLARMKHIVIYLRKVFLEKLIIAWKKTTLEINTPLYGLNSVPLITMIEQKNFEQVMKYIATIREHENLLWIH